MFDWDYFPLYPLTEPIRGRWAGSFIERSDGGSNFYPHGFGEAGYRVDDAGRTHLQRTSFFVRTPFEWLLMFGGCLEVHGSFGYLCLAFGLAMFVWVVFKSWSKRREAFDLLSQSTEIVKPLSAAQRQQRNVDEWAATSRTAATCTIFFVATFCLGSFLDARKLLLPGEALPHLQGGVSVALGIAATLYFVRLIHLARLSSSQAAVGSAAVMSK